MTDKLSIEWLRNVLVELLDSARNADPPDHQACAKYGELLYKMAPGKVSKGTAEEVAAKVREALKSDADILAKGPDPVQ